MAIPCPLRDLRVSVVKKRKNHRGTEGTEITEATDYAPSSTIPISSSVSPYKLVPQPIDLPVRSINSSTKLTTRADVKASDQTLSFAMCGLKAFAKRIIASIIAS